MIDVHLFVEDKTQIKFLVDLIAERFKHNFDYNPEKKAGKFYNTYGAWNEWVNLRDFFKENSKTENNRINLLFADADVDCKKRKEEIETLNNQEQEPLLFKLFLFPDDKNKGNVESLLEQIYKPKQFIECYQKMEA